MTTTRRRLAGALLAFVAFVVGVVGLGDARTDTSAAWTNPAYFAAAASSGQWTGGSGSGPVVPGNAGTALVSVVPTLVTNNPVQVCFTVSVSTTSSTPQTWKVDLLLDQAPFNGATSGIVMRDVTGQNLAWKLQVAYDIPNMRASVSGNPGANEPIDKVSSSSPIQFKICDDGLPPGVQTPGAYTYTIVNGTWTTTQACKVVTVTGNGTSPFYFAWELNLDMTDAKAKVTNFNGWSNPSGNLWAMTQTTLTATSWHFSSNTAADISASQSWTFNYCANGA